MSVDDSEGVAEPPGRGTVQSLGWFRYFFDDDRWEWSPEVQAMHGYEPGRVVPTTELVLSHKHPDDYHQVVATLEGVRRNRGPFSTRHRIIDTAGAVHHVLVVADTLADDGGAVIGTHGFYVDISPHQRHVDDEISAAVAEIAENRAVIEQAKGMLMVVYGIDDDAAFQLLRWQSQTYNVKLRRIAAEIVSDFVALSQAEPTMDRPRYDTQLLGIRRRLLAAAGRNGDLSVSGTADGL